MPTDGAWRRMRPSKDSGALVRALVRAFICLIPCSASCLVGCKSDLSQQLLERELRYQEDQIYNLQDELQVACNRLERTASENASLRKQLGLGDTEAAVRRGGPAGSRPFALPSPTNVPPAIAIPDAGGPARGGPAGRSGPGPGDLAPPVLEDIPPLPREGGVSSPASKSSPPAWDSGAPLSLPTPAEPAPTASAPAPSNSVQRLSFDMPAPSLPAGGTATKLVVNLAQTSCLDANGDGTSDGLALVVEPRDADERLTAVMGDVTVIAFDAAAGVDPATGQTAPIARWDLPAAEAASRFQPQGRLRGYRFTLGWPGPRPSGDHLRLLVHLTPPNAPPLEADATIPTLAVSASP
jgi:hypothetical protein